MGGWKGRGKTDIWISRKGLSWWPSVLKPTPPRPPQTQHIHKLSNTIDPPHKHTFKHAFALAHARASADTRTCTPQKIQQIQLTHTNAHERMLSLLSLPFSLLCLSAQTGAHTGAQTAAQTGAHTGAQTHRHRHRHTPGNAKSRNKLPCRIVEVPK
jgi:hypothetical protein